MQLEKMYGIVISIRNLLFLLVPTEPLNLRAFSLTSQQLNVSWSEPERPNGILTYYTVYYKLLQNHHDEAVPGTTWKTKKIFSNKTTVILNNLGKFLNLQFNLHSVGKLHTCMYGYVLGISM